MRFSAVLVSCAVLVFSTVAEAQSEQATPVDATTIPIEADASEAEPVVVPVFEAAIELLQLKAKAGDASAALAAGRYLVAKERSVEQQQIGLQLLEQAFAAGLEFAAIPLGDAYKRGVAGREPDYQQAVKHYAAAADGGDNGARRALAALLLDVRYPTTDVPRGIAVLEAAVSEGDEAAALTLGALFARGTQVAPDGVRAIELFSFGIAGNSTSAFHALGDLFRSGARGVAADPVKAMSYYSVIAEKGDLGARRKIADLHIRGEGMTPDVAGGVSILEAVATEGDPWAYVALGDLFSRGEFTAIEAERAESYYRKAADVGVVDGYVRLGDLYRTGLRKLAAQPARAIEQYERAAALNGGTAGLLRLGDLYRNGAGGIEPDLAKAVSFYERALALGDNAARLALANLYLDGKLLEPDPSRAVALLEEVAESGDSKAAMTLGSLFSRGGLIPADYDKASAFYKTAAKFGDTSAMVRLASALIEGPLSSSYRSEGITLLTQLVSTNTSGAVSELARLILSDKVPGSRPSDALQLLSNAALGGDAGAASSLLAVYRDGAAGGAVRPNLQRADELLTRLVSVLPEKILLMERINVNAKRPVDSAVLGLINADFEKLDRGNRIAVLQRLNNSNQVAYLAQIQRKLAEFGLFKGEPNGVLDGGTLDAIRLACAEAGSASACDRGPFAPDAVAVLSNFVTTARTTNTTDVAHESNTAR